ncbi:glycoside hydrolase family 30 protein [Flavihumibacter petaseus]|nr:glycoside hydrolase family 30 beta sandwich domain-containing protein [Flavihumibacter petaseus]
MRKINARLLAIGMVLAAVQCSKKSSGGDGGTPEPPPVTPPGVVEVWLTKGDQSVLLQKQSKLLAFDNGVANAANIEVDSTSKFQSVDGFGYTLTGGSAQLINQLPVDKKNNLLQELFARGDNSIGISYLRISIGASDLDDAVFSYNDLPAGQTDPSQSKFDLGRDKTNLIPLLKQILAINPNIKILGSPWSPPVWMKDNGNSVGGSLIPAMYSSYATYFVKYIQAMKAEGVPVDAITIQNEPQHGGNNPSMVMSAVQQADFIKNHLGPAFAAAALSTKIIIWDHNCNNPDYPKTILADPDAAKYVNGSAFHLYEGDISALSNVHDAYPDKALYFTEQWTSSEGQFSGDLVWHVKNVIIGSMRNWSRVALEWNLANDPSFGPHTPGGCTQCKGALTISGANFTRNVSYYIIAHAAKFIPPGAVRISSTTTGNLPSAAFLLPDGRKVLIVANAGNDAVGFNIKFKGKSAFTSLAVGSVATYTW